ncbi:DciA family protein [Streptomyces violaceus]|uniref:DciA family protein n=1 Tax=Streptomyces violaceus TaxID=1936 RepID=A0ABY9UPA1_STRVL|nr:DciA family protein [Streptomyces janthinus]WND24154.1 DciA family protein [Streptomyces janthinus]GGS96823.1 hypothetical protein GCM10010270_80990 [Streptomyces janthinus]
MTDTPQLSGKDLARQALIAYKATARTAPTSTPARPKRKRTLRPGDGRDPVSLATAIANLGADVPLESGVAGGSVIDQWPTLCPQYADTVQPVAYDPARSRLDLRPANYAVASGLRLLGGQLAKQINDKMGKPIVRTIRVLPVGNVTAPAATADSAPASAAPEAPVKTRETAHPGYRAALDAALAHRPERQPGNPYVAEAAARQEAALRAKREPESAHRDAMWELDRLASAQVDRSEAVRRAALARKRQEQTGTAHMPRRAFDVA